MRGVTYTLDNEYGTFTMVCAIYRYGTETIFDAELKAEVTNTFNEISAKLELVTMKTAVQTYRFSNTFSVNSVEGQTGSLSIGTASGSFTHSWTVDPVDEGAYIWAKVTIDGTVYYVRDTSDELELRGTSDSHNWTFDNTNFNYNVNIDFDRKSNDYVSSSYYPAKLFYKREGTRYSLITGTGKTAPIDNVKNRVSQCFPYSHSGYVDFFVDYYESFDSDAKPVETVMRRYKITTATTPPTLNAYTLIDANEKTVAVTQDSSTFIYNASSVQISWDFTALWGASIAKITIADDLGNNVIFTNDDSDIATGVYVVGEISKEKTYTITAVDTRGDKTASSQTISGIEYKKPVVSANLIIDTEDGSATLQSYGSVDIRNFSDNVLQSLTVTVSDETETVTPTFVVEDDSISWVYEKSYSAGSFSYTEAYDVILVAVDTISEYTFSNLATAKPVFSWSGTDFEFNVPVAFNSGGDSHLRNFAIGTLSESSTMVLEFPYGEPSTLYDGLKIDVFCNFTPSGLGNPSRVYIKNAYYSISSTGSLRFREKDIASFIFYDGVFRLVSTSNCATMSGVSQLTNDAGYLKTVATSNISDAAITTDKILGEAVTLAKLSAELQAAYNSYSTLFYETGKTYTVAVYAVGSIKSSGTRLEIYLFTTKFFLPSQSATITALSGGNWQASGSTVVSGAGTTISTANINSQLSSATTKGKQDMRSLKLVVDVDSSYPWRGDANTPLFGTCYVTFNVS